MEPYAVVETGSKQYLVKAGDVITVETLAGDAGAAVALDRVLALSDGKTLQIGAPCVAGATVSAEIVEQTLGPKTVAFKKKRRKGYTRKVGHRQEYTVLKIKAIA
jgi:large subunit ribosomal protein L21